MTKTDRLALLISGRVNVINDKSFLHHIEPGEFLDSPEFESSGANVSTGYNFSGITPPIGDDTTFNVTVCAAVQSRCVVWKRSNLEYMFVKDPHLANAMTTLISRDITLKLYSMNVKLRRAVDGANLDIRLPGIAGRLSEMDARQIAKFNDIQKSADDDETILWDEFRQTSKLDKSDEVLSEYYHAFIAMCKRTVGLPLQEAEGMATHTSTELHSPLARPC